MFASGWLRLWVVVTGFLLVGALVGSVCYVWGSRRLLQVCDHFDKGYRRTARSPTCKMDSARDERKNAKGTYLTSPLPTLDGLAQRAVSTKWRSNGLSRMDGQLTMGK